MTFPPSNILSIQAPSGAEVTALIYIQCHTLTNTLIKYMQVPADRQIPCRPHIVQFIEGKKTFLRLLGEVDTL